MNKKYFSIKEAASRLGVTRQTVKNWEGGGDIPKPRRNSRGWRLYTDEDVEKIRKLMKLDEVIDPEEPN